MSIGTRRRAHAPDRRRGARRSIPGGRWRASWSTASDLWSSAAASTSRPSPTRRAIIAWWACRRVARDTSWRSRPAISITYGRRKATAQGPAGRELSPTFAEVPVGKSDGPGPVHLDIKLKRGVWVTGRLIDSETRKPVRGQVEYFVFVDNPHIRSLSRLPVWRGSSTSFRRRRRGIPFRCLPRSRA